jgi:ADP-ribose pyrophosphatase
MDRILGEGKYARLVERDGWEFVEQLGARGIVVLVATADGALLLVEQFRMALQKNVIELPAGLVGDAEGGETESFEAAARRELLEETGYEADALDFLSEGPWSPGRSNFVYTFFLARGLRKVHVGGGVDGEGITVHAVRLAEMPAWLEQKAAEGLLIDPKIFAGLYFLNSRTSK